MGIIVVITTAAKVARKLYAVQQKYKYLDPNVKFIRKYLPPNYRQRAEQITGAILSGGLIYEGYNIIKDAFPPKPKTPTGQVGKRGTDMEFPSRGSRYSSQGRSYSKSRRQPYCRRPSRSR